VELKSSSTTAWRPLWSGLVAAFALIIITFIVRFYINRETRAGMQSATVAQKVGSHLFVIPKSLVEIAGAADYSGVSNPNPNWPKGEYVSLSVHWPDFSPPSAQVDRQDIRIAFLDLAENPITPESTVLQNIQRSHPRLVPARFDLMQLIDDSSRDDTLEYFAHPNDEVTIYIRCSLGTVGGHCQYEFPYLDLRVTVLADWAKLQEWREIHRKTLVFLDKLRRN
jgi:hypothetical protein